MFDLVIIIIHGIGGNIFPLSKQLNEIGYKCYDFGYQSTKMTLVESAKRLSDFIEEISGENKKKIILIGYEAGGRVALSCENSNIEGIITIASPIQGSWLAEQFLYYLPIIGYFSGPILSDLTKPHKQEIKIPLITITTPNRGMWKSEMTHKKSINEKQLDDSSQICEFITESIEQILDSYETSLVR